jgi:hypothetical protein
MRIVSFDKALNITIHNQYPNLELTSPVYFSTGTICHVSPNQQVNTSGIMEASFEIDSNQRGFEGALLYKLQKKHTAGTDNQSNGSTTPIEDAAANIYLLVSWNYDYDHKFYACLIRCSNNFTWNEAKLGSSHREYTYKFHWGHKPVIMAWLVYDGAVMKTKLDIIYESGYKLDIIISEEVEKYNMEGPMRLVLSLSMLVVLIYTVSPYTEPLLKCRFSICKIHS